MIAPELPFHWLRWFVTASNTPRAISTPSPERSDHHGVHFVLPIIRHTSCALGKRRDWARKSSNSSASANSRPVSLTCPSRGSRSTF
jgi:hypothetical protein